MGEVQRETEQQVLAALSATEWTKLLDAKCQIFGYRCVPRRLLYWSVWERQLLRSKKTGDATKLLQRVAGEINTALEAQRQDLARRPAPRRASPEQLRNRFNRWEPDKEVVTREWVGGSAELGSFGALAARHAAAALGGAFSTRPGVGSAVAKYLAGPERFDVNATWNDVARLQKAAASGMQKLIGLEDRLGQRSQSTLEMWRGADSLRHSSLAGLVSRAFDEKSGHAAVRERFRLEMPERVDRSTQRASGQFVESRVPEPYHVASEQLQGLVVRLSGRAWQRLSVEREAQENQDVRREVQRNDTAVSRAVKALIDSGRIVETTVDGVKQLRLAPGV
jgi:hypothetical protein